MNIQPLRERILVRRDAKETQTASGFVLPEDAVEKPFRGKVLAIGNGKLLQDGTVIPLLVNVGDHIYFHKHAGVELKIEEDPNLFIMREEDVLAIIKPQEGQ